ncbi:MAG: carbon-nitrogen hydrolase family protein [Cycloclasticus sp.]|uniref:carbon-nitrogen hydrolase family protein n=1 Tax=Cycloclasticus sp. TaxID=2024830 RepID=UPI00257B0F2D|nr:carbon-nitrogen hydrolase family protein [Cycloclasticus sp.]MBV1897741.1 carbon-nitrogen hydrolase family protein [Cycloclasticus sp.]
MSRNAMMKKELTVAAVQMTSSDQLADNLTAVEYWVNQAVSEGAKLVVLPENFALMAKHSGQLLSIAETLGEGAIQSFLSELSKKTACWIVAGSLPISSPVQDKVYATCLVYNAKGERQAYYHKMHLFDVDIADGKKRYRESENFLAGDSPVVVNTPFGKMGLSICYDLRFPELYRELLRQGAEFMVVPSAFTELTGQAHWSLLCRARAVENSCYMIAANQGGQHNNGRSTFGHSMIVGPWGDVLSSLDIDNGIALATFKKSELNKVRTSLPAIQHRRL